MTVAAKHSFNVVGGVILAPSIVRVEHLNYSIQIKLITIIYELANLQTISLKRYQPTFIRNIQLNTSYCLSITYLVHM